jgi:hypothetical protein
MKRVRQTFLEISKSLSLLEVDWMADPVAVAVVQALKDFPVKTDYDVADVVAVLKSDFVVGSLVIRLFLDLSKDDYERLLCETFPGPGGGKITRFYSDPEGYAAALAKLGLLEKMALEVNRPVYWFGRLQGLFEGGWGSARKGQLRGRMLEDFVQGILEEVFREDQISPRCQFTGATGISNEKADFAIPNAKDALILIEVKAFNATGSKQTDVLGDIMRIVEQKRDDTIFLLVTDGISWRSRASDLKKIVELQNIGKIGRIYTKAMAEELRADLKSLKQTFML